MACLRIEWQSGIHEGQRIIKLAGPLTLATFFEFQEELRRAPTAVTIIDMADVSHMDSMALGALLGFHVSCHKNRRKYGMIGLTNRLQTLLTVSGVGGVLLTYASLREAEEDLYRAAASAAGKG